MRTLTTAQQREITSPADVKLIVNSSVVAFQHISSPVVTDSGTYMNYDALLEIDDWNHECDWLGGMSAISDMTIRINNTQNESDILGSIYHENEEITVSIMLNNSTVHTIYKGLISDWTIDQETWELDIIDETFKYDVPLLTEVTVENYPDAWSESFGLYLPLLYCFGSGIRFPAVNVRKTYPKLIFANHSVYLGDEIFTINYYYPDIETYIKVINPSGTTLNTSTTGYYEFYGAQGQLSGYRKYTVSRASAGLTDLEHIGDADVATHVDIDANELLSITLDLTDLGYIEANADVECGISTDNRVSTPYVALYNLTNSTEYGAEVLNADSYTFTPAGPDDAGTSIWTFSDLQNYEWLVKCEAGESLDLIDINFSIIFRFYNFSPLKIAKGGKYGELPRTSPWAGFR